MKNSVLYPITNRYRMALSLDGMWQFQFDPRSCGLAENWKNGLPSPISMPVPASFSDFFTSGPDRDYCGDFWYQKDFFVPETVQSKVQLRFGSITHRAIVFCNGAEVARHEGGFLPVVADVTDVVRRGAVNRVCIWVNNDLNESTPAAERSLSLISISLTTPASSAVCIWSCFRQKAFRTMRCAIR